MSKYTHHYTSDDLDLTSARNCTLLLQVGLNVFSYAVISGKQLMSWGENYSLDELLEPHQLRDILIANYKQTITGLHTTGFTLLPQTLFDKDHVTEMARLLDITETEKIKVEDLDSHNTIIYKVDESVTSAIKTLYNQTAVYADAGWIKVIARNYPLSTDLYLNLDSGTVSFVYFLSGRLRYYNTFKVKNHEELAYFCGLIAMELGIKPENTRLILSGDINTEDKYFTYLQEFFSEVITNSIQILDISSSSGSHKLLSLAALSLCASSEEN
jgi:hypothetical protein